MASLSSLPPSSSPSTSDDAGEKILPSSPNSSSNEKAARALEALMWPHDHDSTMSESSLGYLRGRYGIPEEFVLTAPEPGQRANKGWKGRFFFVCRSEDWGFGLQWAARVINYTAPSLNDEERKDLRRLKEILPTSRVIREMTEGWLVEAGLSPTPREMVNLVTVRGGRSSSVTSSR
uniref:Uncharacterized protein n=1 Tax=Musa acuminata subsp. malaccensis TaxID=214687 RepID=A0A804K6Z7_MUSAM